MTVELKEAMERVQQADKNRREGDSSWCSRVYEWPYDDARPGTKPDYQRDRDVIVSYAIDILLQWGRSASERKTGVIHLHAELETCKAELQGLQDAIRKHRDQRGDDRCWMDDEELYRVLSEGYTPPKRDSSVEIDYCKQFIECRHNPGTTYVSPQRRIEELEAKNVMLQATINGLRLPQTGWITGMTMEDMEQELARYQPQPIETAPKDREILLRDEFAKSRIEGWWDRQLDCWWSGRGIVYATHWCELPPVPKEEKR